MTVLVIGAAGHIGGNLVRALLQAGRRVRAGIYRDDRAIAGLPVEKVRVDVLDPASLDAALQGVDVVYHLAAVISLKGAQGGLVDKVNVLGPRNVAEACLRAGVRRLVHFSSIHAFSQTPLDQPLDETRGPPDGKDVPAYDRSKAAGEREIACAVERGLDAVIVNPTSVVGPFDFKPSPMGDVIRLLGKGKIPALVKAGFDFVDVRDVVAGAMAAEERGRKGERYLLPGRYATFTELARLVAEVAGAPVVDTVVPFWMARLGAPFLSFWCSLSGSQPLYTSDSLTILRYAHTDIRGDKAARELGYRARPLEETVRDTWDWFRCVGMA